MSAPTWLSRRRSHAATPHTRRTEPTAKSATARAGSSAPKDAHSAATPKAIPLTRTVSPSGRIRSPERCRQRLPGQLALGDEAPGRIGSESTSERGYVAARDEHDRGGDAVARESLR